VSGVVVAQRESPASKLVQTKLIEETPLETAPLTPQESETGENRETKI
jgi:hypothetical protein